MTDQAVGPIVYLDANPFIYAVEGDATIAAPLKELFEGLRQRPGAAVTSELTLAEVLAPDSSGTPRPADTKRLYFDLIVWSKFLDLRSVSREVLLETTKVRSVVKLKLPDAIHLCTAILGECRFFLSKDRGFTTPSTMRLIRPDQRGVAEVLEALG